MKNKKSCKNCAILKELHKIGRDCNNRQDYHLKCCEDWVNGHCRNKLDVKIES